MNGEVFSTDIKPGDMVKLVKKQGVTVWKDWDTNRPVVQASHAVRGDWALVIMVRDAGLYVYTRGRLVGSTQTTG